jgi:hypothetical protein
VSQARAILATLLLCLCVPVATRATQVANLHVSFTPMRLGHDTSVAFEVKTSSDGHVPSPLTRIEVHYPSDLGLAVSELGLATCAPATLEALGPAGCPADSRMGRGNARAEIAIGPRIIQETAAITILRAPQQQGRFALLFYAVAEDPITAKLLLPGLLLPGPAHGEETIRINLPLIHGLPGGPDVAITQLHATFGPHGLVYYEHIGSKLVPYQPRGILLPSRCPNDGFSFGATLTALDGSHTSAHTIITCSPFR